MEIGISTLKKAVDDIADIYRKNYIKIEDKESLDESLDEIRDKLEAYFERLREGISLLIETNYVDKMYRDLYYNYFSTKLDRYSRNCIRISFFHTPVTEEKFYVKAGSLKARQEKDYLGFLIIRPTFPNIIGRNVISPRALKPEYADFKTCATCFSMTANGVKFDAVGFPHASQDGEMLCCADVTIWAMMEYFGNKYPEYCVVHPSKTLLSLENVVCERQLPRPGLSIENISYVLKEHGFAPKIYSREECKDDFDVLFSCYVESGFPIVAAIEATDDASAPPIEVNHAVICTGHVEENMETAVVEASAAFDAMKKGVKVYDWNLVRKEFIFMDDNLPPYQKAHLDKPLSYYSDPKITHFVVPLYSKVYLDAREAKKQIYNYIINREMFKINESWGDRVILRTFLTSSRSYKQYIMHNEQINRRLQNFIINMEFPKFIWVGELTNIELVKQNKINGLVILDSTEPRFSKNESLLLITNTVQISFSSEKPTFDKFREEIIDNMEDDEDEGNSNIFSENNNEYQKNELPLHPFDRFESNIKNYKIQ